MLSLGTKIKKVRELKSLKQDYMAEMLGISQSSYSKIETDEVSVSPERLEQIAKIFEISVEDILSFDERVFFNITNREQSFGSGYFVQYNSAISENEKKLYEDKIKLLEEVVEMQRREIERLKGGK